VMPCESVEGYWIPYIKGVHGYGRLDWRTEESLKSKLYISSIHWNLIDDKFELAEPKKFLTNNIKDLCYEYGIELKRAEPYEHAQAGKQSKEFIRSDKPLAEDFSTIICFCSVSCFDSRNLE
jgi:hypothetical protein